MKANYIKPEIKVIKIETQGMIQASLPARGNGYELDRERMFDIDDFGDLGTESGTIL